MKSQELFLGSDIQEQEQQQQQQKQKSRYLMKIKNTKYPLIIPLQILGISIMMLDLQSLSMCLPVIMEDFNLEQSKAQLLVTFNSLGSTTFSIPLSNLAKRYGLIRCLIIYHIIHMSLFLSLYFINNFGVLCIIRFISGAFQTGCSGNRNALSRLLSYPEQQQKNLLYNKILLSINQIVWPLILGIIIDKTNYRVIYLIEVGLDIIQTIYISFSERVKKEKFGNIDILGIITLFISIACFSLCFNMIGYQRFIEVGIFGACGIIFLIGLIFIEMKVKDPVVPYKILKQPTLDYLIGNILIMNSAAIYSYLMPLIFSHYGKSSTQYSYIVMANGIIGFIISLLMPIVSKRFLNKHIIIIFSVVAIIVSFVLPFETTKLLNIVIIYLCYTGLTQPRTQLLLPVYQLSIDQSFSIQIAPLPQTFGNIMKSIIIPILTTISQLCQSGEQIAEQEYQTSLSIQFSIIILWNVIYLIITLFRTGQLPNEKNKKHFNISKVIYNDFKNQESTTQQKQDLLQDIK